MEIHGFEVEARAADGATPFGAWCGAAFGGVEPVVSVLVASMDEALASVVGAREVERPAGEGEGERARVARIGGVPGGVALELVEPAPPGSYEASIDEFVAGAADLDGPATEVLADGVLSVLAEAWGRVDGLFEGVAHNKVLAVMLLLSQRARAGDVGPDAPAYWQRSAASTLASGFVSRGATDS